MSLPSDNLPNQPTNWIESERLGILARYGSLDVPPEPHFEGVVKLAAHLCSVPFAMISLFEEKCHWVNAHPGCEVPKDYLDLLHADHSIFKDGLHIVMDISQDSRFQALEDNIGFRFYASMPIRSKEGLVMGVVCVMDHHSREFSTSQRHALKTLSERIEHYIEMRILVDTQYKIIEYLRANDERIQTALHACEIGTWDWDILHDCMFGDVHYALLLNISAEKAGSGFSASTMFEHIHEEDRYRGFDYLTEFFSKREVEYAVEYRIKGADGVYRWICSRGRCYYMPDGKPRRLVGCSYPRDRHRPKDFSLFEDSDWTHKQKPQSGGP